MRLTQPRPAWAKLGFAHRTLWARDETYRIAFVLGPPVMLGALLGAAVWLAVRHAPPLHAAGSSTAPSTTPTTIPWATPEPSGNMRQDAPPVAAAPDFPLPPTALDGRMAGLDQGWDGRILAVRALPLDVAIPPAPPIARYQPGPGPADMDRIVAAAPAPAPAPAPASFLFVGLQTGLLRVTKPGPYRLTLRLQRSAYQAVNCVMRLGAAGRHVLSQYDIGVVGQTDVTFDPVAFTLQPGLYKITMAFGCWHDSEMAGPGQLTLMIGHPGDPALLPARPDEIFRPATPPASPH